MAQQAAGAVAGADVAPDAEAEAAAVGAVGG